MTFDEYQQKALSTALQYDDALMSKTIRVLGISGEASEVAEKWKKILGYHEGKITDEDRGELGKELADVVWYIAVFAHELGLSFDDIMQQNVEKLASRKARGVIKGKGDNR